MWKEHFDLVSQLQETISRYIARHGKAPTSMILSPAAFEWLLAIFSEDKKIFGVSPIDYRNWTYNTDRHSISIVIDEMTDNYEIRLA